MVEVGTGAPERLVLAIPPEAGYLATARMFAATVARHFRIDEDRVDDVKLAISEACTASIRAAGAPGQDSPVQVTASATEEAVRFEVTQAGDPEAFIPDELADSPASLTRGLGMEIIRALFEEAEVVRPQGEPAMIRFSVARLPDQAA